MQLSMRRSALTVFSRLMVFLCNSLCAAADEGRLAHWPLAADGRDISAHGLHATPHSIGFSMVGRSERASISAGFDGRASRLEIAPSDQLRLGHDDFTVAAWVHTDAALADLPGDLVSQYDVN